MAKVTGIDLGSGNSCVAVMEGGKPKVIENAKSSRTHALDRCVYRQQRGASRATGQTPGHYLVQESSSCL